MIIELKENPSINDVLIYNGKEWSVVDKESFTKKLKEEFEAEKKATTESLQELQKEYEKQIETLEKEIESFKTQANEKFKTIYNAVEVVMKGN